MDPDQDRNDNDPLEDLDTRASILVVDDEDMIRDLYCIMLGEQGYRASGAPSGMDAISMYRTHLYDLVITDLHMKPMNGLALCKALRAYDANARIVVNSGSANADDVRHIMHAGALHFFKKPVDFATLQQIVQRSLR